MNGAEGERQAQKVGLLLGAAAAFLVLRRLRKRRKAKKILKQRAKAKAKLAERRRKELKSGGKGKSEKGGKEKSMLKQLVRFAVFQFLKKLIMQQIKQMEVDLGKGKLGKRIVEAAEGSAP